jgi:hypothetical protein
LDDELRWLAMNLEMTMDWQPIETCPKDERVLLGKWHDVWFWIASGEWDGANLWSDVHDEDLHPTPEAAFHAPTHWANMFEPPNQLVSRGGTPSA